MTRAERANRIRKRRPNHLPEHKLFEFMLTRAEITQGKLETPCYLWKGSKTKRGYGLIGFRGRPRRLHRVVWILKFGDPAKLEVCHHCDVPSCFNPEHLFLGTHLNNMQDAMAKGRILPRQGEAHGCHKLTEEQVKQIRAEYVPVKMSRRRLAKKFGVSYSLVCMITRRKLWKHI